MAKNEQKRVALFKKIDRERKKALGLKDWGMKGRRDKKPGKAPPDAFGYE